MKLYNAYQVKHEIWYIVDWAGNDKTGYYGEFKTFEDAHEALLNEFEDLDDAALEEQLQEFEIIRRK
jgi:hypothetical protein